MMSRFRVSLSAPASSGICTGVVNLCQHRYLSGQKAQGSAAYVVDGNAGDGGPFKHIHCSQSTVTVITVKVGSLSLVVVAVAAASKIRQVDSIGLVGEDENKRSKRQEGAHE